jgi:integrase
MKLESYLYTRNHRYWADLREYADVGGDREAMKRPNKGWATTDEATALEILALRIEELEKMRREKLVGAAHGIQPATLKAYAAHHLKRKKAAGRVTDKAIATAEHHLSRAVAFFGAKTYLHRITVAEVTRWAEHLSGVKSGRGGALSGGTIRHHLNDLSNLFRRAQGEGRVQPGFNPVGAMMDKPNAQRREAEWLEVHDAALVLEAARLYKPERKGYALHGAVHPLVATFLLTGGRQSEVLGLDVEDVSFDRRVLFFRPNAHRRLKTSTSHRTVPLWPQLEEILRAYVFGGRGPASGLLFPSPRYAGPIRDLRKVLDELAAAASLAHLRTKMFRHTYCAARLQTLDTGAPVSPWTVAQEMGHGGRSLVDRVYGHLGNVRHRAEVVEYRVGQHRERLGERLRAIQAAR